jgi:hypothetical protein
MIDVRLTDDKRSVVIAIDGTEQSIAVGGELELVIELLRTVELESLPQYAAWVDTIEGVNYQACEMQGGFEADEGYYYE